MPHVVSLEDGVLNSHSHENIVQKFSSEPRPTFLGTPLGIRIPPEPWTPLKILSFFFLRHFFQCKISASLFGNCFESNLSLEKFQYRETSQKTRLSSLGLRPRRGRGGAAPPRCRAFRSLRSTPWHSAWRLCRLRAVCLSCLLLRCRYTKYVISRTIILNDLPKQQHP